MAVNVLVSWVLAAVYGRVPFAGDYVYAGMSYVDGYSISVGSLENDLIRHTFFVSQWAKSRSAFEDSLSRAGGYVPSVNSIDRDMPAWSAAATVRRTLAPMKLEPGEVGAVVVDRAFGFPTSSMRFRHIAVCDIPGGFIPNRKRIRGGIRLPWDPAGWQNFPAAMPLIPIPLPFALNTLFYFVVLGGVWSLFAMRPGRLND